MIRYAFCDSAQKKSQFMAALHECSVGNDSPAALAAVLCDVDACEKRGIPAAFARGTFSLAQRPGGTAWAEEVFGCIEPGVDLTPIVFNFPKELLRDSLPLVIHEQLAGLIQQVYDLFEHQELDVKQWNLMFGKFIGLEQYYSTDDLPAKDKEARMVALKAVSLVVQLMNVAVREAIGLGVSFETGKIATTFAEMCEYAANALEEDGKKTLPERFLASLKAHVADELLFAV